MYENFFYILNFTYVYQEYKLHKMAISDQYDQKQTLCTKILMPL